MQKLQLEQKLVHKLSGQYIQYIKLLQVPTIALNAYISKEVVANPLLDDAKELELENDKEIVYPSEEKECTHNFFDYYATDLTKKNYKTDGQASRDTWTPAIISLQEKLKEQLHLLHLNEVDYIIGEYLIGNLNQDGYLQYDLEIMVQDLYVTHYLKLSLKEVKQVLMTIQRLDPPGIAARNLQECLFIQLHRQNQQNPVIQLAQRIINSCFKPFTQKHYECIIKKLGITDRQLFKDALAHIARLNPKPGVGHNTMEHTNDCLSPDFIITEHQGKLTVELIYYPVYTPRFNKKYLVMLETYEKKARQNTESQEIIAFLKKKLEDAKWFMEALGQRNQTLLKTMEAILQLQYKFFLEGEEVDKLSPMVLQNVADKIGMDASTISRIVNQKSVQGKFGIYPLKFFFSEGMSRSTGEDVSNKAIKNRILELINSENKQNPYPDRRIGEVLVAEGYNVARRTVAKYREQLHLPVARLRKVLK